MSWHGIEGHDEIVAKFRTSLGRGRLASTFLFVGPSGIGKRTFARKLAQSLLCPMHPEAELDPCETCPACQQVLAGTHPDLDQISRPEGKSVLPVELFIGADEKRMQEGLCHRLSLKPFMGGRRVAIIDDADYLAAEGANCLLKTLEEPPPRSVMILIGTSVQKQLPTIRSRSQIIRFQPLAPEIVAGFLLAQGVVNDRSEAVRLAAYSGGSIERAIELADPDVWEFRRGLLDALSAHDFDSIGFTPRLTEFVDAAGKDAPPRRARCRQAMAFAADFYRHALRVAGGAAPPDDGDVRQAVERFLEQSPDSDAVAESLARCLTAIEQVDRNANQTTLLECWLDDLARMRSGAGQA